MEYRPHISPAGVGPHIPANAFSKIIVIAIGLLLPAVSLSADTYRWKDRDGKVHYGAVVPPEYAGQPYDTLNEDGIVIEKVKPTTDVQALTTEQETGVISPSSVDQERRHQADRLLLVQYQSEAEITTALELEITHFGYDTKLINLSFDATNSTITEFIRNAADQQRAGQPIRPEQQKEITRLYRHLNRDKNRLANIEQRKTLVRARFQADLKRYRELKLKAKEQLEQG